MRLTRPRSGLTRAGVSSSGLRRTRARSRSRSRTTVGECRLNWRTTFLTRIRPPSRGGWGLDCTSAGGSYRGMPAACGGSRSGRGAHDSWSSYRLMDPLTMLPERRVHIVDDEAKVRDALTLLLSTAQIESKSYGSAEEYLTSNSPEEPACVLLDNQLPGMSGIELLRQIAAATKESTVIMITAYGDVPTAVLAMKAGAFHFVQKPFDAEALLATVEEALSPRDDARD